MARYRSIRDTMSIIKEEDPDTAITEYMLRELVANGVIPYMPSGNRKLVDADKVRTILYGEEDNS